MSEQETSTELPGRAEVIEAIRPVCDPELHISVVDLGLVYDVELEPAVKKARVNLSLTSPGCPAANEILVAVRQAVEKVGYSDVMVNLVWEPRWDPHTMASDEAKDRLGIW